MTGVRALFFALVVFSAAEAAIEVANAYEKAPIFVKIDWDIGNLQRSLSAASVSGLGWGAIEGTELGYRHAVSSEGFTKIDSKKSLVFNRNGNGVQYAAIFTIDGKGVKNIITPYLFYPLIFDGVIVTKELSIQPARSFPRSTWVDMFGIDHQVKEAKIEVANAYGSPIFIQVSTDRKKLVRAYAAVSVAEVGSAVENNLLAASAGFTAVDSQESLVFTTRSGLAYISIFAIDKNGAKREIAETLPVEQGVIVTKEGFVRNARSTWVDVSGKNHKVAEKAKITVANAYTSPILVMVHSDYAKLLNAVGQVKENAITLGGEEGFKPIKSNESFVFEPKYSETMLISILTFENGKMRFIVNGSFISPRVGLIVNKNGRVAPAGKGSIWVDTEGTNHRILAGRVAGIEN